MLSPLRAVINFYLEDHLSGAYELTEESFEIGAIYS